MTTLSTILLNGVTLEGPIIFTGSSTVPPYTLSYSTVMALDGVSDQFGYIVAAQNNILVVSDFNKINTYTGFGAVRIYTYNGASWSLTSTLGLTSMQMVATSASTHFGNSVAIAGNWIAVGAPGYSNSTSGGAVFLYQFNGTSWPTTPTQQINLTDSSGYFGWSVSLDQVTGSTLAIGQIKSNTGKGSVEIWSLSGSTWSKSTTLSYTGTLRSATQTFGYSVDINNNILVSGGPGNTSGSGTGLAFISQYSGDRKSVV